MKLVIMQPYLFPYLGYYQLVHASDRFVFYDDVSFIRNGWINRNRLLLDGAAHYFTVPLSGASSFQSIHETRYQADDGRWRRKLLGTFHLAYRRAPFAAAGMRLIEETLALQSESVADLARHSVKCVLGYLGIKRDLLDTSRAYGNAQLRGQDRVIDICRRESASLYLNAPGGRGLYDPTAFAAAGIGLRFLNGRLPEYAQGSHPFVPGLSILDSIMHCAPETVAGMLGNYELVAPQGFPPEQASA